MEAEANQRSLNSRARYHIFVALAPVVSAAGMVLVSLWVSPGMGGTQWTPLLLTSAAFGVLAAALCSLLLRRFGSAYAAPLETGDPDGLTRVLEMVGKAPLSSLIVFLAAALPLLALKAAGLAAVSGADALQAVFAFLLDLSIGMIGAAFLYILLDKLTLRHLLAAQLTRYPLTLREDRQKRKTFIIPLFMTIMTFLLVLSFLVTVSFRVESGGGGKLLVQFFLRKFGPLFLAYLVVVLALMRIWMGNTSLLYRSVIERMDRIVSGEKDLTGRVAIGSVDELATIAGCVNEFSGILSRNLALVKDLYGGLYRILATLFESVGRASAGASAVGSSISATGAIIQQVGSVVERSTGTGKQLLGDIAGIVGAAGSQNAAIRSSAEAVNGIIQSVAGVAGHTREAREKIRQLVEVSRTNERNIAGTIASVETVSRLSNSLMQVNTLIASIASQTNLLAMNASIEAAHAGEAGRGFSVVANEIRSLAEHTAVNTKKSRDDLRAILAEIGNTLAVSRTTGENFAKMLQAIGRIEAVVGEINSRMEDQDRANRDVLAALQKTLALTDEVQRLTDSLKRGSAEMLAALEDLGTGSRAAAGHAGEMAEKNRTVKAAMDELTALSAESGEANRRLTALLEEFRIG